MIKIDKPYKVFSVKEGFTKKGDHYVNIGIGNSEYNNETKEWTNKGFVNVFATTGRSYQKGEMITIKEITAIDTNESNGKTYITVFAKLEELEFQENYEVSQEELPF